MSKFKATPITEQLIKDLVAKGAKPVGRGKKLGFPTSAPGPWAKLPSGLVINAEERGELLVAV